MAFRDGVLVKLCNPEGRPTALEEFVHDSFRSLVENSHFSCVAAKAAMRAGTYRMALYGAMSAPSTTRELAQDLLDFLSARPSFGDKFSTFIASFDDPEPHDERAFEKELFAQLESLNRIDESPWDPSVRVLTSRHGEACPLRFYSVLLRRVRRRLRLE